MKYIFGVVFALVVVGIFVWFWRDGGEETVVTNFEECAVAGNLVMESFPRQCRHGDKTFIENIGPRTKASAAISAVQAQAADEQNISEDTVSIVSSIEKEWPDACLGLAGIDEMCAQVITPGFEIVVKADGKQFIYRTNADGTVLRKEK